MLPFAMIGFVFAARSWHALPEATKKYLANEKNNIKEGAVSRKRFWKAAIPSKVAE